MVGAVLLCAGGTGGHLFPAEALATALRARGFDVHLATDHRVESIRTDFPAANVHVVPSATIAGGNPFALAGAAWKLARGFGAALRLIQLVKPVAAVGFGGYPSLPPMLAARSRGVPTILHEANAVLGRANRFLATRVTTIAASIDRLAVPDSLRAKVTVTGNPVRAMVLEAARRPYEPPVEGGAFRLLVFGGSQGARFFSELMPEVLARLDGALRQRLSLVQQCRPEDIDGVMAAYGKLGIDADLAPFFRDLPARIAGAHLVVSRSGASTASELAVIGRPAIMVPLPHALDQDQTANATVLAKAGAGWMIEQAELEPGRLAAEITRLAASPDLLTAAAAAAKSVGRPDAVNRLADLVESVAVRPKAKTEIAA